MVDKSMTKTKFISQFIQRVLLFYIAEAAIVLVLVMMLNPHTYR